MGQVQHPEELQKLGYLKSIGYLPEDVIEFLTATSPTQDLYAPSLIEFPDVSFYQGTIDWAVMSAKTKNIIIRAGQQVWVDSEWVNNWPKAKQHGMKRGCYFFFDGRASPQAQWNTLAPLISTDRPETVVWIDWELNYGGAYEGLKRVVELMKLVESNGFTVGIYTGYYWFIENSSETDNPNEYAYLANKPLWLAQYGVPSNNLLVPPPWNSVSKVELHQFGTPSIGGEYGVQSIEIDMNRVVNNHERYDTSAPPVNEDIETFPFKGVRRITGRRFNSNIYVTIMDTAQVLLEVVHEKPLDNGLFFTSAACISQGAQLGWNGDEWDKASPLPAYPKNAAWSMGVKYKDRTSAEPSLNVRASGVAEIIHAKTGSEYNTSTGRRYLIEAGVIKSYLNGSEPQYTERHPRGLTGLNSTGNRVIMVTVDGRTEVSAGITLKEGAQILLEFGAHTAFDRGGGGDAVDVMNGNVQNVPCDTDVNGNPGVERAIPQAILVYAVKETEMTYAYEATSLNEGVRIRTDHSTQAPYKNFYPVNTLFEGDEMFTATMDLAAGGSTYQQTGDKWLKVLLVNGAAPRDLNNQVITVPVWVAVVHMGGFICSLVENTPEPPPNEAEAPSRLVVTQEDGSKWEATVYNRLPDTPALSEEI